MKIKHGATRTVFLIRGWAIKIPRFYSWKSFLNGLLANMQEREFSQIEAARHWLCPVLFSLRGGWLVVMPRLPRVNAFQYGHVQRWKSTLAGTDLKLPVEEKLSSFGWLDGRVVAIDYGS